MIEALAGAFLVGLLGGVHCAGMCGGIVGALTLGLPQARITQQIPYHLAYNGGRIFSYVLAGGIMGGLGMLLAEFTLVDQAQRILLIVAGIFMILLGFYLAGWWRILTKVEEMGSPLWRRIEPYGRRFIPVKHPRQAILLGLIWGWLPCGLVYSALIWSVSSGGIIQGALLMFAFGLGTLPNLLLMGTAANRLQQFIQKPIVKSLAGLLVIAFGVATLYRAF
jgi:uncharacterized protein